MHDWLKETHKDFPKVSEKTVYNFVMYVRQRYNIPQEYHKRDFFPVEELPYGKQSQVDFGEYNMRKADGNRKKVYFFSMILSRSRQRFVCFNDKPYTTVAAITAHEKAFCYFEGIPSELVYDQDKLFLSDENKGDLILTKDFKAYTSQQKLTLHFCRKSDPQSKGKIENTIKYIKQNFLYNRLYQDIDTLNEQALEWLSRTANVMVHHSTRLVPEHEWNIEKSYLRPYTPMILSIESYVSYHVRKDNTIAYKGNFYTLPEGTYKGKGTQVLLKAEQEKVQIFNLQKEIIHIHPLCTGKGKLISNNNHKRDNTQKIDEFVDQLSCLFDQNKQQVAQYMEQVRVQYPRYIRDHLLQIRSLIEKYNTSKVLSAIQYCIDNNILNTIDLKSVLEKQNNIKEKETEITDPIKLMVNPETIKSINNIQPDISNIADYEKIIFNLKINQYE
jgi:hypothetical protein